MSGYADLIAAIQAGDRAQVEQMLDTDPALINAGDEDDGSAVLMAVYYGQPAIARLLIERGASLNLFEAAAVGNARRIEELIDADPAAVNAYAPDGFQALGLASFFGHLDAARLLLERGADVNSPSHNPQMVMPLHSSVAGQHFELTQLLIEHGADVNATQQSGFTPLQGAAQNGQVEMVELLLAHGANKTARNHAGQTAGAIARAQGHEATAALLG